MSDGGRMVDYDTVIVRREDAEVARNILSIVVVANDLPDDGKEARALRSIRAALDGSGGDGASVDALMAQRAAHWGRFFDAQHGLDDEDRIVYERFRALAAAGATGEEGSERWS